MILYFSGRCIPTKRPKSADGKLRKSVAHLPQRPEEIYGDKANVMLSYHYIMTASVDKKRIQKLLRKRTGSKT